MNDQIPFLRICAIVPSELIPIWCMEANQIVVLNLYSETGFKIPKQFDGIYIKENDRILNDFKLDNIIFRLEKAILNGWTDKTITSDIISKGHKHICLLEFKEEIPAIFNLLPTWKPEDGIHNSDFELILCNRQNFSQIASYYNNSSQP